MSECWKANIVPDNDMAERSNQSSHPADSFVNREAAKELVVSGRRRRRRRMEERQTDQTCLGEFIIWIV